MNIDMFDELAQESQDQQEFQVMQNSNELNWLKARREFLSNAFDALGYNYFGDLALVESHPRTLRGLINILQGFVEKDYSENSAWVINGMYLHGINKEDFQ